MTRLALVVLTVLVVGCTIEEGTRSTSRPNPTVTRTDLASGFRIIEWHMDPPNSIGYAYVRGEVRNNNRVAAGVKLQVIARDSAGRVIDSEEFWPASILNIPPGTSEPIGYPATDKPDAVKFELRIIDAHVWD